MKNNGATFIELIIVVLIMGLLSISLLHHIPNIKKISSLFQQHHWLEFLRFAQLTALKQATHALPITLRVHEHESQWQASIEQGTDMILLFQFKHRPDLQIIQGDQRSIEYCQQASTDLALPWHIHFDTSSNLIKENGQPFPNDLHICLTSLGNHLICLTSSGYAQSIQCN